MFTAASFIIAKEWYQPKCPSAGERIHKTRHSHTMEHYAARKRNGVWTHTRTWMNSETLCEVKEASHKKQYTTQFYVYEMLRMGKSIETERLAVRAGRMEEWGETATKYRFPFGVLQSF